MITWKALFRTKSFHELTQSQTHTRPADERQLKKTLGVTDLTAFGVAAILGAGVFSTIGTAASQGGPAVIFLFIFTAIACAFSAVCYAEFASSVPIAGSAYTYAYASFGELIAWIIGWDLLIEYAIGNIAVAISWSQYFVSLLDAYGIHIPRFLTMDFLSASRSFDRVQVLLANGKSLFEIGSVTENASILRGYTAWVDAPRIFNLPIVCDLPTLLITALITGIVYIGIEESKKTSNVLVVLKLAVVLLVIFVGATYVQPANWIPFAPNGVSGVLKGVSAVFFSYIGFDAISTTAEECKNPQKDLPRGMIYSLLICTVLYSLTALVLTGMVSYKHLNVGDPLAFVFGPQGVNIPWIAGIVNISAVIALATVLLIFQIGQPRIWMAMSRDGLLPPIFSAIHPKYRTPWFSTLLTGLVVAIPSLFMNLTEVTDLTSIGTLFAFILVCGGVLRMQSQRKKTGPNGEPLKRDPAKFSTPYINSKYIFPGLLLAVLIAVKVLAPEVLLDFFSLTDPSQPDLGITDVLVTKIPMAAFSVSMIILAVFCFLRNLSLIPVLGVASCGYLMTELGMTNWIRFGIWLVVGFFVYFLYGFKHSRLGTLEAAPANLSPLPSGNAVDI